MYEMNHYLVNRLGPVSSFCSFFGGRENFDFAQRRSCAHVVHMQLSTFQRKPRGIFFCSLEKAGLFNYSHLVTLNILSQNLPLTTINSYCTLDYATNPRSKY